MKALLQRSLKASVTIKGETVGAIDSGLVILLGVRQGDTEKEARFLAQKLCELRIFEDENEKLNLSLLDVGEEALVISQFTLCADCKKGRRPSFTSAEKAEEANRLYELFCELLTQQGVKKVARGVFGAMMDVSLVNSGPVTIMLDTDEIMPKG